ncbi:hypothetical protein Pfo_023852 [Paulownia fortunei]|nr:hypothetical protein Pfo_023852 [Paulownia fortunei]
MEPGRLTKNWPVGKEILDPHAVDQALQDHKPSYPGLLNAKYLDINKGHGRLTFSNQASHTESVFKAVMEPIGTYKSISLPQFNASVCKLSEGRVWKKQAMPRQFMGVRQRPSGRYVAEIEDSSNSVRLWLGTYDTALEAALAYDEAARALKGTQARTNFHSLLNPFHELQVLSQPSSRTKQKPTANIGFSSSHQQQNPFDIIPPKPVQSNNVICNSRKSSYGSSLKDEEGSLHFFTSDTNSGPLDFTFLNCLRPPRSATTSRFAATLRKFEGNDDGRSTFNHQVCPELGYLGADTDFPKLQSNFEVYTEPAGLMFDDLKFRNMIMLLSRIQGHDLGKLSKYNHELINDLNMSCGEASTRKHGSNAPEVRIDIWKENDDADHTLQITHQAWKEHINQLKKSRLDNYSMMMMTETTLALGGQAVGAVMANALTCSTSSSSSWAVYLAEFAVVLGLSFTLAGISLSGKRRALSILMTKIGAIATATAIIISMGSHLPPVMAWTVGPVAFLIMAVAASAA